MIAVVKKIVVFVLCFYVFSLQADADNALSKKVTIQWKTENGKIDFDNAIYLQNLHYLPAFSYSVNMGNVASFDVQIEHPQYEQIPSGILSDVQLQDIANEEIISKNIGVDRKNYIANVTILPLIKRNGQVYALTSFDLTIKPISTNASNRISGVNERTYTVNSVLNSGKWYKFGILQAGIYKLDYAFLKQLGMAVEGINPANIRIFGHRAGMLPELAGTAREDDIREIPIKVISVSANRFENGDYILAYFPGPEKWKYDVSKQFFVAQKHLYSDTKNFFITADNGIGARINTIPSSSSIENKIINTYNDYGFIEEDKINIAQSGKQFVGDEFGGVSDKSYRFSFPNMSAAASAKLNIAVVGKSETMGATFTVSTDNGGNNNTIFIPNVPITQGIVDAGVRTERLITLNNLNNAFTIQLNFNRNGDFNTKGWLDFLQINTISTLRYNGQPLLFRSISSVGAGAISKFSIQNMNTNAEVWDVTNPFNVQKINYNLSGNIASFNIATDSLKEFAITENTTAVPIAFGSIPNQNLHVLPQQDMLIITRSAFLSQAQEIAQFHRDKEGLRVAVAELNQVFNEFSSGNNDITAVRDFIKMFYDRAAGNVTEMPKYVLLLGDGSYNNKNLGDYFLPTYQSNKSYESLETYVSDDYFGLLDDNEGGNITNTVTELLDVGVGRIPADDVSKAQIALDKIKTYYATSAFGDWRNQGVFIADDEDYNIHEIDADTVANQFIRSAPKSMNIDKIYIDAFQQQSASGGATYPAVNDAIDRKLFTGTLFLNYVGHGGPNGLAKEKILTFNDINLWNNATKLPLFITATCEFAPYDNINENTAGEQVFFKQNGGAIALVTTTRVVYSNRNRIMNGNFMQQMSNAYSAESMTLGDIIREAKKITNTRDGNRKFTLLGDPALRLAFPKYKVVATTINNTAFSSPHDTLKALSKITIEGEVLDNGNALMTTFNGTASVSIYDKIKTINTLINDPASPSNPDGSVAFSFELQKNIIYKGKSKVTNGKFKVTFLVPKDIDYNFGNGKISMYASADNTDAAGNTTDIIIGGAKDTLLTDNKGPNVDVFLNDDKFVFGGITDESPRLFCRLYDENGINTSGNGVGHDITAILDKDTKNIYNLNDFYETTVDDISRGIVNYPISKLAKGRHTLEIKAWDVLNNSGVGYTEFIVEQKANLALSHVLNYPNPFTTHTRFMFEHNKPGVPLDLKIEIFSVSGKVVKTILKNINTPGYRVDDITWDGLDDYGDKIGKGVYIYRVTLKEEDGKKISQYQKLVILN
jgi:hypothetical protein